MSSRLRGGSRLWIKGGTTENTEFRNKKERIENRLPGESRDPFFKRTSSEKMDPGFRQEEVLNSILCVLPLRVLSASAVNLTSHGIGIRALPGDGAGYGVVVEGDALDDHIDLAAWRQA